MQWDVTLGWARNVNRVEALNGGTTDVPLGPSVWGAALVARPGSPVGAIVGTRFLRDGASHALLLSKGLPLSDGSRSVLGSWQPDWTSSLGSSLQLGPVQVSMLADARIGGRIFSATNLWGSYAGTLQATVDRPTQGLLIAGVDSGSRSTNAIRVSAQDYFHALGGIGEPWVYDASSVKLREARVSYTFSLPAALGLQVRTVRFTLIGRNLLGWAKAPNIDPETTLSTSPFQGFEMGQLPTTRSLGLQIGIAP
jgi:hypothetical protein